MSTAKALKKIILLLTLITVTALGISSLVQAEWQPPIGIPTPPFGLNEVAPTRPNPWTTAVPGYYYVEWSATNATDTNNPYGTPTLPRKTIPLVLPAGSVVELHGTYGYRHSS